MAKKQQEELTVGEDSFLDTIANLVGILIIFVVIVGAKSQSSAMAIAEKEIEARRETLEAPAAKTENLNRDIEKQLEQLQKYEVELAYRNAERMAIVDRITMAEQVIEEQLSELDDTQVQELAVNHEISELERQLSELLRQQGGMGPGEQQAIVLQHLPTPMAKTVFGRELHIMMHKGQVTVIPWEQLLDALKQQVRRSVERNTQREKIDDRLGPIDGFVMHFKLLSKSGLMSDGRNAAMGKLVELDKFDLEPTPQITSETIDRSLATGGRLRLELANCSSQQTTITVWVYPDSFGEFRKLKERLFVEGFLCAARPLPNGMRIGASPRGSSSVAQ